MTGVPQGPDPRALFGEAFSSEPAVDSPLPGLDAQDPRRHFAEGIFEAGLDEAQKAQSVGEHVAYGLGAGAKAFGDSITNIGGLAFKAGGALASGASGQGVSNGWEHNARFLEHQFGQRDPSILDLVGRVADGRPEPGVSWGEKADQTIQRRLGNAAIAWQTVGHLASFATGPGAGIARGAARMATPLAGAAERGIARAVSRGTPGAAEALQTGHIWQFLANSPEWQRTASLLERTMAKGGQAAGAFNTPAGRDLVGMAAANVAQSVAMTPDAQRNDAGMMALFLAPLMLPIARAGERLGGLAMRAGMNEQQAKNLQNAYLRLERGEIGIEQLDEMVRANVPMASRIAGGAVVAPAFEGTAFMFLDPAAREELQKGLGGDTDAWGRLGAMWIGTAAGVAAVKHMVPHNLVPFFKAVRPDANSLSTYLEAEANRRARFKPAKEAVPAEPEPAMPEGWEKLPPDEVTRLQGDLAQRHQQWQDAQRPASARQGKAHERQQQRQETQQAVEQEQAQLQADYGWAESPTLGLLRGGWEPRAVEGSKDVELTFGRDHTVTMAADEGGQPILRFDPRTEEILADHGIQTIETEGRKLLSPAAVEYRGPAAKKVLDDLTLVALTQRLRGDLTFQRAGFREVAPGQWADSDGTLYMRQLDGSTVTRKPDEAKWTERNDIEAAGYPEGQQWTNDKVEEIKSWLVQKFARDPEPVVDSVLMQAIALAHNGDSFGAEQMRLFFDAVPLEALADRLQSPDGYRMLAMEIGSVASAHNNAQNAAAEIVADAQHQRAAEMQPDVPQDVFAGRMEGELPADPAAEAMAAQEQSNAGFRGALEEGSAVEAANLEAAPKPPLPVETRLAGAAAQYARQRLSFGERIDRTKRPPQGTGEAGANVPGELKEMGRGAWKRIKEFAEFAFRSEPEVLTKGVPDDALGYEIRERRTEGERLRGEAVERWKPAEQAMKTRGKSASEKAEARRIRDESLVSDRTEGAEYARWRMLADKKIEPENALEQAFVDSMQEAGRFVYEEQRKAGATRLTPQETGPAKYMPAPKRSKFVQPYRPGSDSQKVYANAELRRGWHEALVSENPGKKVPKFKGGEKGEVEFLGGEEPLSVEWLERMWKTEQKAKSMETALRETAAEHFRFLDNVPDVWKGHDMLETNAFKATTGALAQQAARASILQKYGPDVPKAAREAALKEAATTGESNPMLDAFRQGRLGVEERLGRFAEKAYQMSDTTRAEKLVGIARQALIRAQGGRPEKLWAATEAFRDYLKVTGSAMAAPAFVLDIPEPIFRTPIYAGFRNTLKGLSEFIGSPRETLQAMDMLGAIERDVADTSLLEASGKAQKLADFFQAPGAFTERIKAGMNASVANVIVRDLQAGKMNARVRTLLLDELRISPEQMAQIDSGQVTPELANQIRREITQAITSRVKPGEGSRLAANPNTAFLVRFARFATRRMEQSWRTTAAVGRAWQRSGPFSKETGAAMTRMIAMHLGMTAGGLAGSALSNMLLSTVRGEGPGDGLEKLWREFTYAPFATAAKAWRNQLVGGPFAQLISAATEKAGEDPKAWANLTVLGQVAYAVVEAAQSAVRNDHKGVGDSMLGLAADLGVVPFRSQLRAANAAFQAARLGEDRQALADARSVREFMRFEGIQTPYGARTKPAEFYESIGNILKLASKVPTGDTPEDRAARKDIVEQSMEDLRSALSLAPEDSVASAIEGHMLTRGLTNENREKLHQFLDDPARIARVYQHDAALHAYAREVRKLEGTSQTPFVTELEQVVEQAQFGGADRWRGLSERAVDDAAQRLLAGDGEAGTDIDELASAMSTHGEQVASLFDRRTSRYLQREDIDSTAKARVIRRVLLSRAQSRRKEAMREQRREAAEEAK